MRDSEDYIPELDDFEEQPGDDLILGQWNLNLFDLTIAEKYKIIWLLFNDLDIFSKFKLSLEKFPMFLYRARVQYQEYGNPYHNFDHAINGKSSQPSSLTLNK